jgi:hypothetical protein
MDKKTGHRGDPRLRDWISVEGWHFEHFEVNQSIYACACKDISKVDTESD